jgi:outer membrane receptor for ferric coprogen and ferric-rhodotorulic acid
MKLLAIVVLTTEKPAEVRASEFDLSQFGFFQRGRYVEIFNVDGIALFQSLILLTHEVIPALHPTSKN